MLRLGGRQMYLILILLLLSPSVYFGGVYAAERYSITMVCPVP